MLSFIINNINYVIALCVVVIFYILIISYLENKTYDSLNGEEPNNTSKNYIYYTKLKHNKSALDYFRLGTVYLFHYKDLHNANKCFTESLKKIKEGDTKNAIFILDKLEDYEIYFLNNPDIRDLQIRKIKQLVNNKLQSQRINRKPRQINNLQNKIQSKTQNGIQSNLQINKIQSTPTVERIIPQKLILANQNWTSDSQNVHDSSLHNEFKNQLLEVINENQKNLTSRKNDNHQQENLNDIIDKLKDDNKLKDAYKSRDDCKSRDHTKSELNFSDAINFYKSYYKNDRDKMEKLSKVLINLESNNPIHINNLREQDVITAIWQRAHDPKNSENTENIKQSLGECILDCVDKGAVVCLAGRTSRYWQSLSNLDYLPEMGILQTKQAIRNEIYEKCASIVHTELRNKELMDYYNSGNNNNPKLTAELNEAIEKIIKSIDSLGDIYKDKLPNGDLSLILNECKAII